MGSGIAQSIDISGKAYIKPYFNVLINIATLGMFYLICKVWPELEILFKTRDCRLFEAECALVVDSYGNKKLFDIQRIAVQPTARLKRYIFNGHVSVLDMPYGRFLYDQLTSRFVSPVFLDERSIEFVEIYKRLAMRRIETEETELYEQNILFGENVLGTRIPSIKEVILSNITNPYVIWEAMAVVLWVSINYYCYALIMGLIYLYVLLNKIAEDLQNRKNLAAIAVKSKIEVFRNGQYARVWENKVFPGDLVKITPTETFKCDVRILKGDVIVDESFLTGESVPVCKGIGDIVYSGTKVIKSICDNEPVQKHGMLKKLVHVKNLLKRAQSPTTSDVTVFSKIDEAAQGLVINTGKKTKRGQILKNLMFKRKLSNDFIEQSRNISNLLLMYTFLIVVGVFVFLSFHLPILKNLEFSLDILITFFSPSLNASLKVGIQHAQKELKKKKIHTTDSERINTAGEVDVAVFDKTGTLTELGVDILCVDTLDARVDRADELDETVLTGLSTCHGVMELDGKYSGDTLDMKMFVFSRSQLVTRGGRRTVVLSADAALRPICREEPREGEGVLFFEASASHAGGPAVEVVRTYDFDAGLKRMSVVVQTADGRRMLYCKGAPDSVAGILAEQPAAYADRVHEYGLQGYRVLALACRELGGEPQGRAEDERALRFCGLIVFANRLKAEAPAVVGELRAAGLCPRMCTGDGIVTAISIARECGMIERDMPVLFPLIEDDDGTVGGAEWCCIANEDYVFDRVRMSLYAEMDRGTPVEFVLACGGKEYAGLRETAYFRFILERGVVFARFTPENKKTLIEDYGRAQMTTLYCGDGANDTGALSAADVGLALATNEASLAASFSSSELTAAVELVKEGRSALAMSAAQFKYMLYSQVLCGVQMLTLIPFLYFPSDLMSLVIDILSVYILGYAICSFKAAEHIHPVKYKANMRKGAMLYIWELITVAALFLVIFLLLGKSSHSGAINVCSRHATITFFIVISLFIFKAILVSDFGPYRQPRKTNIIFIGIIASAIVAGMALLLLFVAGNSIVSKIFQFRTLLKKDFLIFILGFVFALGSSSTFHMIASRD